MKGRCRSGVGGGCGYVRVGGGDGGGAVVGGVNSRNCHEIQTLFSKSYFLINRLS